MRVPGSFILPLAAALSLATAPAEAQPTGEVAVSRVELAADNRERTEASIDALLDDEEAQTGPERAATRLRLALAYAQLGERDERRRMLELVSADPEASEAQIQHAAEELQAMDPRHTRQYANPFDEPLVTLAVTFAAVEAAALIVGGSLLGFCDNHPNSCSSETQWTGVGFLAAGSVWWLVPTAIGVALGVLDGLARGGLALDDDPAIFRF